MDSAIPRSTGHLGHAHNSVWQLGLRENVQQEQVLSAAKVNRENSWMPMEGVGAMYGQEQNHTKKKCIDGRLRKVSIIKRYHTW